jgi:hypothetical protein
MSTDKLGSFTFVSVVVRSFFRLIKFTRKPRKRGGSEIHFRLLPSDRGYTVVLLGLYYCIYQFQSEGYGYLI